MPLENLTMVSFGLAVFETPRILRPGVLPSEMEPRKTLREAVFPVGSRARRKRPRASSDRSEL